MALDRKSRLLEQIAHLKVLYNGQLAELERLTDARDKAVVDFTSAIMQVEAAIETLRFRIEEFEAELYPESKRSAPLRRKR